MVDHYTRAMAHRAGGSSYSYGVSDEDNTALHFAKSITGQESLEGEGLTFYERAKISMLGETEEEKEAAFSTMYPEGEYLSIPNTDTTLFRRNLQEAYQVTDPSITQALGEGRLMNETLRDIGDFAGDAPEILGEIAAVIPQSKAAAGVVNVGRGFLNTTARLFGGAAGGSTLQQGLQEAAGTQRQSFEEVKDQSITEGMLSVFGGTLGDVFGRGINMVKRGGLLKATPEGQAAQEAADRLGMDAPLPISAMTDNPILRLLSRQSGSLTSAIGKELREFNTNLANKLRESVDPQELRRFAKRGWAVLKDQNFKILSQVNKSLGSPSVSLEETAPIIKTMVDEWWNVQSKGVVDSLYSTARKIEEPQFDLPQLQAQAREILRRPTAEAKHTVKREKIDAPKKPYWITRTQRGRVNAGETNPAVEQVANKILSLDPDQAISVDFLRGLQQEVYDASLPGMNGERLLDAKARQLRGIIGETLHKPRNTDPAFVDAWDSANKAAVERFETRELMAVSQLINSDRPVEVLSNVMNKPEALTELARTMSKDQFSKIGKAFQADTLGDPGSIVSSLNKLSPMNRRLLMSEAEEKAMRNYGRSWERLNETKLEQSLLDQANAQSQVSVIINNPSTAGIESLRKLIRDKGGISSPFGTSLRAGILNDIFTQVQSRTKSGAEVLSSNALDAIISKYEKSGVLRFLSRGQQSMIKDIDKVQSVLSTSADAGTALRAAQQVSGMAELESSAFGELIESLSIGRILTSETGRKLLVGNPAANQINLQNIRLMGAVLTSSFVPRND